MYEGAQKICNHHSARAYPDAVTDYIKKEKELSALVGPFEDPPFTPWCKVSPLMTRPKNEVTERRVIVDLSFPDGGVNKYIPKNIIDGEKVEHKLPTVQQAVNTVIDIGMDRAVLASIDISRAYRNFRTCPADWPLLVINHKGKYFIDVALPFGCRASSYFMQNVALFICRALQDKGIKGLMYLDDLLIIADGHVDADEAYMDTLNVLRQLGLPVAPHKLLPPTREITWLGICLDLDKNSLSIPRKKMDEMRQTILETKVMKVMSTRQLQRVVGVINHVSKAVPPARLFMCRLLEALWGAKGAKVEVTEHMLADIKWFDKYLCDFNGKALIPDREPSKTIEADACLSGFGAHDGGSYYSTPVSEKLRESHSISRLECLNCLLSARTFIGEAERGKTVLIRCDNEATVYTYMFGRGRDSVMLACARAMWLLCATLSVNLIVQHVPGVQMQVADSLSRVFNEQTSRERAMKFVHEMSLSRVYTKPYHMDYSAFL